MNTKAFVSRLPIFIILISVLSLMVFTALTGCRHHPDNLSPYGWRPVSPMFDTLTIELEQEFNKGRDTLHINRLIGAMCHEADRHPDIPAMSWRAKYWQGRLYMRQGDFDKAISTMHEALGDVDTSAYPYDAARIRWNLDINYQPPTLERYNELAALRDLMATYGDIPLEADYSMQLGCLLNDVGCLDRGMPYLDMADSLFRLAGLPEQTVNNKINRANALNHAGKTTEAVAVLRSILSDTTIHPSPDVIDLVMGNIYVMDHDVPMLYKAWLHALAEPTLQESRIIYADYLAEESINVARFDSAAVYHSYVKNRFAEIENPETLKQYYTIEYLLYQNQQRWDSAFKYLKLAAEVSDSINASDARNEISNANTAHLIAQKTLESELNHRRSLTILLSIIFIIIICCGVLAWFLYNRIQEAKIKNANAALEVERAKRRITAMRIVLQENNSLIDDVDAQISSLVGQEKFSADDLSTIKSSLRSHSVSDNDRKDFIETFGEIDPDFTERLRAHFPALTDSDLKLCVYIALKLDNKHIARIAHIRPQSVKQARWRLRSKLNLNRNENLDDFIISFLSTSSHNDPVSTPRIHPDTNKI